MFALLTQIICSLAPGTGCRDRAPRVAQPSAQASQPLSGSALRRARSEGGGPGGGTCRGDARLPACGTRQAGLGGCGVSLRTGHPPPQGPAPLPPRSGAGRRSGVSQLTFAEREAGTGSPLCDLEELTPPSSALGASVRLRFDVVCEHQVAAVTWLLPERNRALGINSLNMRITSSP